MSKFKVGDKVVPIGDSIHISLNCSSAWMKAMNMNQEFLYIKETNWEETRCIACAADMSDGVSVCSIFKEDNLIPYVEPIVEVKQSENDIVDAITTTVQGIIDMVNAGFLEMDDILLVAKL